MNDYFGNGEIFYYHVAYSDTRPARKEEGGINDGNVYHEKAPRVPS